jgi:hypothetical protein
VAGSDKTARVESHQSVQNESINQSIIGAAALRNLSTDWITTHTISFSIQFSIKSSVTFNILSILHIVLNLSLTIIEASNEW